MMISESKVAPIESGFSCRQRLEQLDNRLQVIGRSFEKPHKELYGFLAECHELVLDIGSDASRVSELVGTLNSNNRLTKSQVTRAKTVVQRVSLWVFCAERTDLLNKSTRSLYTRVLDRASSEDLSKDDLLRELTAKGIYAFATYNDQIQSTTDSGKGAEVTAKRRVLMARRLSNVPAMDLLENRNPQDGFVMVLYRADSGKLIPCLASDETRVIDGTLRAQLVQERLEIKERAKEAGQAAEAKTYRELLARQAA